MSQPAATAVLVPRPSAAASPGAFVVPRSSGAAALPSPASPPSSAAVLTVKTKETETKKPAPSLWHIVGGLIVAALVISAILYVIWLFVARRYLCNKDITKGGTCSHNYNPFLTGKTTYKTQSECLTACAPTSWDCSTVTGQCTERQDALGAYTTQDSCKATCSVAPTPPAPVVDGCNTTVQATITDSGLPDGIAGVVGIDAPAAWQDTSGNWHVGMTLLDSQNRRIFASPSLGSQQIILSGTDAVSNPTLVFLQRSTSCSPSLQVAAPGSNPTSSSLVSVQGIPVCWGTSSNRSGFTRFVTDSTGTGTGTCETWTNYLPSVSPLLNDAVPSTTPTPADGVAA